MQRIALTLALIAGISVLAGTVPSPAGAASTPSCTGTTCTVTFDYTGAIDTWTVPAGVTSATFDVYGAAGGSFVPLGIAVGGSGGKGGHVHASVAVTPGEALNLRVGGRGDDGLWGECTSTCTLTAAGGFNGGGSNSGTCGLCAFFLGGGGGGASDVRTLGDGLADRLLVAGGGGGAGIGGNPGQYGDGGDSATGAPSVTGLFVGTCSGGSPGTLVGPGAAGGGATCVGGNAGNGANGGADGGSGAGAVGTSAAARARVQRMVTTRLRAREAVVALTTPPGQSAGGHHGGYGHGRCAQRQRSDRGHLYAQPRAGDL